MTLKTPAIMNQYGDTYTGIPNGRATTKPCWPRLSDCSSWPLATPRCYVHQTTARVPAGIRCPFRACPRLAVSLGGHAGRPAESAKNVGGLPYRYACGHRERG